MNLNKKQRIDLLVRLGEILSETGSLPYRKARAEAFAQNPWFIPEYIDQAIRAISTFFLERQALERWAQAYPEPEFKKEVGLILAGNIPLVGMHDLLSVFVPGHRAQVKLSSKDEVMMHFLLHTMERIDPGVMDYFHLVDRLKDFDAVIATGSNNTFRYFSYYFDRYPHIIRKNRNGVAVLTGAESTEELGGLVKDILDYFGLGCRNVTKLYVPRDYDFGPLIELIDDLEFLLHHHKYRNNYEYNYALFLLNKDDFLAGKNILVKKDASYLSRIACLHYEFYDSPESLKEQLEMDRDLIQCICSPGGKLLGMDGEVPFGKSQVPGLFDYADGVDTMQFLTSKI